MEDLFKKFLYTGVGIVSTTADKMKSSIDDLVDKGKNSQEEGKKAFDDFMKDAQNKKEDYEGKFKELFNKALRTVDLPSKAEVEALNAKIAELEEKLAQKNAQA